MSKAMVNGLSAKMVTTIVRAKGGETFSATAYRGWRQIQRAVPGTLALETVRADTWVEALRLAYAKWGWSRFEGGDPGEMKTPFVAAAAEKAGLPTVVLVVEGLS